MPPTICPVCKLALPPGAALCPRCSGDSDQTWTLDAKLQQSDGAIAGMKLDEKTQLALSPDQRYLVIETIGQGGMGIVYKVQDKELDETIAIKVLRPELGHANTAVERFKQEVKIARRINHPNVARLFDIFLWRGQLAISQEYISGHDLGAAADGSPMAAEAIVSLLRYLCSALQAAHDLGVVHRDLKPGNIRIAEDGRPKILDFGLAVLAESMPTGEHRLVLGTPAYMSPEQAFTPKQVDRRADLYSLGVIMFRLATGDVPFTGRTAAELMSKHRDERPPRPRTLNKDIPVILEDAILRCLEKEPERRYASANDLWTHVQKAVPKEVRHQVGLRPPVRLGGAKRGKVLVIEDERVTRALLRAMLENLNLVVTEAGNGYEGVEAALRETPDLIILDVMMPVLDGRETLRILKSNPKTAATPVIVLTGLEDASEAVASKATGAAVFLNKPVQPAVLELLVEKYLG